MKKYVLQMIFLLVPLYSWCQLNPVWNVQTPEVASLGQYGKIPVGKYTGVTDIDVPIYTLKVGNMSFPLSFSYHLASLRPNTPGGCLGLGWNLMAGGYITRTVHGCYDEKCDVDGNEIGYYGHSNKLKDIDSLEFAKETDSLVVSGDDYKKCHELSADEFSFQFFGYSGNFYFNEDRGWTVVSDQDIKVEFDEKTGFMDLNEVRKRINTSLWSRQGSNNRFFCKFTLVTPDGTRYEFGGLDAIEFSVSYYGRNDDDLIPTTWRLSKIVTPEKREITFSYDALAIQCDLRYVPQKRYMDISTKEFEMANTGLGRANFTGFLLFPTYLKKIETPNDTLDFVYYRDVGYPHRFYSGALCWEDKNAERRDFFYTNVVTAPSLQFGVFLGYVTSVSDVRSYLKNYLLHCIRVRNGMASRTYYFGYSYASRLLLSQFTVRKGHPALIENIVNNPDRGEFLANYIVPPVNEEDAVPTYRFEYNTSVAMPDDYVLPMVDSWGYYVGKNVDISEQPNFDLVYPNLQATKALTLSKMIYPTGGSTEFEYESHDYSKIVSLDRLTLISERGSAGGLRLKEIRNKKRNGIIDNIKRYYYSFDKSKGAISSGVMNHRMVFHENYIFGKEGNHVTLCSAAGFSAPVTNLNTPDVGYSCVIEETLDSLNNSLGYVKSYYSNFDQGVDGKMHLDSTPFLSLVDGINPSSPFSSNAGERGKLLREEICDKWGTVKKRTDYSYTRVVDKTMKTAEQRIFTPLFTKQGLPTHACIGGLHDTQLYSWMSTKIEETTYFKDKHSLKKSQTIEYDDFRQQTKSVDRIGDMIGRSTTFQYPYHFNEYSWLAQKHFINLPVRQCVKENGFSETSINDYEWFNNVPYVSKNRISYGDNEAEKINYEVLKVDSHGNPLEILKDGMHMVLVWDEKGQLLQGKLENLSISELQNVLGKKYYQIVDVEQARSLFPFAHITIYKYNDANLLESASKPDGTTDYYKYDFLGRLREIYYFETINGKSVKRIKERYDYQMFDNSPKKE